MISSIANDDSFPLAFENQDENMDDDDIVTTFMMDWKNETNAPCLLPFATENYTTLLEACINQESKIAKNRISQSDEMIIKSIYETEIIKVKYMLGDYLNCRLDKLHFYWMFYSSLTMKEASAIMSPQEYRYIHRFRELMIDSMNEMILKDMPADIQEIPGLYKIETDPKSGQCNAKIPKMDANVICKVLHDIGPVQVEPRSHVTADLMKGDIYVLQFRIIYPFLIKGLVQLL